MAAKFGDDVPKRVEEMLREISSLGRYQPQSTAGRAVLGLTRNVSRALTSINYRSWARQLGGVMTLATEMPAAAYRAGLAGAFGKGVFEEMTDASPFLWNRYAEAPSMMLSGLGQVGDVGSAATVGKTLGAAGRSLRRGRVIEAAGTSMKALDAIRIASFFDSIAARVAWAAARPGSRPPRSRAGGPATLAPTRREGPPPPPHRRRGPGTGELRSVRPPAAQAPRQPLERRLHHVVRVEIGRAHV